jgi:hypothetical protein
MRTKATNPMAEPASIATGLHKRRMSDIAMANDGKTSVRVVAFRILFIFSSYR